MKTPDLNDFVRRFAVSMLVFGTALLGFAPRPGLAAQAVSCAAPPEFASTQTLLSHVAAELQPGGTLEVLAVGSLTMTNPEPLSPQSAFPYQMAEALRRMLPGREVNVTMRGGKGLTAADMLQMIHEGLAEHPFKLVIWQTGTVDAVKHVPPAEFFRALNEGAALSSLAGANVLLVDTQYSRMITEKINLQPYEDAMHRAATLPGVALFRRYELMRDWATDGTLDLEHVAKAGREDAMGTLQACLGDTLARLVVSGTQAAK